jgi:hypothetical protein
MAAGLRLVWKWQKSKTWPHALSKYWKLAKRDLGRPKRKGRYRDKEERQEKNEENMSRQILKNVITETKINSNFILKRKTFEIFYLFCSFVF